MFPPFSPRLISYSHFGLVHTEDSRTKINCPFSTTLVLYRSTMCGLQCTRRVFKAIYESWLCMRGPGKTRTVSTWNSHIRQEQCISMSDEPRYRIRIASASSPIHFRESKKGLRCALRCGALAKVGEYHVCVRRRTVIWCACILDIESHWASMLLSKPNETPELFRFSTFSLRRFTHQKPAELSIRCCFSCKCATTAL